MDEHELRDLIEQVKAGRLSRRQFIDSLVTVGLGGPIAIRMLAAAGVASAQPREPAFLPARRGGGGALKVLMWQGPTILNPALSVGWKDSAASRIFYEPLASFGPDGSLVPILAREIPSVENGGVARDGLSVTWKLKPGVAWHDGKPFTADDIVFTWEYTADPATGSPRLGISQDLERVEQLDRHTVRFVFKNPTAYWATQGCGWGLVLPRHVFEPFKGAKARDAPANLRPVGTGPYRIADFKPGDVIRADLNAHYHVPNRPFFDTLEVKGGGDAVSAARAVLQTGEYDFAPITVDDDVLRRLEDPSSKGHVEISFAGSVAMIQVNQADPRTEVDGERSSVKVRHPLLTDPAVRQALPLLVDRASIQEHVYGRQGIATANMVNAPPRFVSKNRRGEFSVDKANQILDAAGWKRGPDGIRAKDGKKLKLLFQASINTRSQKIQQILKQAAAKAGIEIELKTVPAATFFGSDPANPDTYTHFYADLQLISYPWSAGPDPERLLSLFASWNIPQKHNKWQGYNVPRWRSEEYDSLFRAAQRELDPATRAVKFIRLHDLLVQGEAVIPLIWAADVAAIPNSLHGVSWTGWDLPFWRLAYWFRQA